MENKNIGLSAIRIIATLMILLCHICQFYNFFLAWWLNVGVQIFLTLSGYIFGKKYILNPSKWLLKRFIRIYISYILLIIIISLIYVIMFPNLFSVNKFFVHIFCLQGIYGTFDNLYHKWYITYILICYMLTPLLQFLFDKQYKVRSICFIFFIIIFLMWIITGKLEMLWLISYIIGYFMGKFDFLNKLKKTYITVIIIIAVVACSIKVILSSISFTSIIGMLFVVYSYLTHILLGLMLFCVIYFVENKLYIVNRLYNILLFSMIDKLSYEIYLVHQIFILGTFSIILLCKSMFLNYMILAIMILLISFFLNFISGFISKKVKQLYNI